MSSTLSASTVEPEWLELIIDKLMYPRQIKSAM